MPYLMLDDNYPHHRKVEELSDKAFRLHVSAMAESARHLLDGYLNPRRLAKLDGYRPTTVRELLDADLLHEPGKGCGSKNCPDGRDGEYLLHDYLAWNKSREWWTQKRANDADRQAQWRAEQEAKKVGGVTT